MVLARVLTAPLRLEGTSLPSNVLLMVRLLAIVASLRGYMTYTGPHAAFLEPLEHIPFGVFSRGLSVTWIAGLVLLLFTRRARAGCLFCGCTLLLSLLSSIPHYSNHTFFASLLFILSSLSDKEGAPRLLQWQVALLYLGAGLNKALEADWWSGQFFDHWLGEFMRAPRYLALSEALPPMLLAKLLSWSSILTELLLGILFLIPKAQPTGVRIAFAFHLGAYALSGLEFNIFFHSVLLSMAAFASPLPRALAVSAAPGFPAGFAAMIGRLDADARHVGPPPLRRDGDFLALRADGAGFRNGHALVRLVLSSPALLGALFITTAVPGVWAPLKLAIYTVIFVLLVLPTAKWTDSLRDRSRAPGGFNQAG